MWSSSRKVSPKQLKCKSALSGHQRARLLRSAAVFVAPLISQCWSELRKSISVSVVGSFQYWAAPGSPYPRKRSCSQSLARVRKGVTANLILANPSYRDDGVLVVHQAPALNSGMLWRAEPAGMAHEGSRKPTQVLIV